MAFSKQKEQVLRGLESGRKLHEFIREPGMPSKNLLEELRAGDPEFEAAYQKAEALGRKRRGEPTPPADHNPSFLPVTRLRSTTGTGRLDRPTAPGDLVEADVPTPVPVAPPAPAPKAPAPVKAHSAERAVPAPAAAPPPVQEQVPPPTQEQVLAWRRSGMSIADIVDKPGMSGKLLSAWRRETEFATQWDAASAAPVTPQPTAAQLAADMQREFEELRQRADKGTAFKTYVHQRLDAAGIAGHHEVIGQPDHCRIGKRLDDVLEQVALVPKYREEAATWQAEFEREGKEHDAYRQAHPDQPAPQLTDTVVSQTAPQHPGRLLASLVQQAGTCPKRLATALGLTRQALTQLLCGRTTLTLPLCAALERANWGTAQVWAQRQIDFTHATQPVAA